MWSVRKILFGMQCFIIILQWSYGVLCWEVFSTGIDTLSWTRSSRSSGVTGHWWKTTVST